jgi:hypothetical protein
MMREALEFLDSQAIMVDVWRTQFATASPEYNSLRQQIRNVMTGATGTSASGGAGRQ